MNFTGFKEISNAEYHSGPGLSSTGIKNLLRAPVLLKTEKPQSKDMAFGSLFHLYILEPEKFFETVQVLPPGTNLRTKAGKAVMGEIMASRKDPIKEEVKTQLIEMKESLRAVPIIRHYLWEAEGVNEMALFLAG